MIAPLSQKEKRDHNINACNDKLKLPSQEVSTTSKICNELSTLFTEAENDTVEKTVGA
jgi:hypothetical protein